jgi:hypothetical protein
MNYKKATHEELENICSKYEGQMPALFADFELRLRKLEKEKKYPGEIQQIFDIYSAKMEEEDGKFYLLAEDGVLLSPYFTNEIRLLNWLKEHRERYIDMDNESFEQFWE